MFTLVPMHMARYPAEPEIEKMSGNDGRYGRKQQQEVRPVPDLLAQQEQHARRKKHQRQQAVVVFSIALVQGASAYHKGQQDHKIFKRLIFNDIYAQNRQTG